MTTATASVSAAVTETVKKLAGMRDALKAKLVEREEQVRITQIAIASRVHVILHGDPGNAKSLTVDSIVEYLPDLSKFKTQAYKASPPEQFLGTISLKAMEEDRLERIIAGKLPDVDLGIVDETPRTPRALLPAFQGMMVEREFDSGNGVQPVPLMTFVGTSNHLPDDPELEAFFDRFTFKLVVKPPLTQGSFIEIMRRGIERRRNPETFAPDPDLLISRAELVALQESVPMVNVPEDVLTKFGELWSNLLARGVAPSIRRQDDLLLGMQAQARLDGRDEVIEDDLLLAQHSLWTAEDEIDAVYEEVVKFASQWEQDKHEHVNAFGDIEEKMVKIQADHAQGAKGLRDLALDAADEMQNLRPLIERAIADASGRDTTALDSILSRMDTARSWISANLMGGLDLDA